MKTFFKIILINIIIYLSIEIFIDFVILDFLYIAKQLLNIFNWSVDVRRCFLVVFLFIEFSVYCYVKENENNLNFLQTLEKHIQLGYNIKIESEFNNYLRLTVEKENFSDFVFIDYFKDKTLTNELKQLIKLIDIKIKQHKKYE